MYYFDPEDEELSEEDLEDVAGGKSPPPDGN
jgi:hypothetical protein